MKKGDHPVKKTIHTEAVDQLFKAILSLKDTDECYAFFEDICTINELLSLSQRFDVGIRLMKGQTYQEIAGATGSSTATISRVNRLLGDGSSGLEMAAERIKTGE
jgi:TrpR-related protein YerC/YecD